MLDIQTQIDDLLDNFKIAEAHKLCIEARNNPDLSQEEQEQLLLQSIRCIIYSINLEKLYGYVDDNNITHYSEDFEEIMDVLERTVLRFAQYLDVGDQEKVKELHIKACEFGLERYLYFLPVYAEKICDTATSQANTRLIQGYLCLIIWLGNYYMRLAKKSGIANVKLENYFNKHNFAFAKAMYEQANVLYNRVVDSAVDFPRFTSEESIEAGTQLIYADLLLDRAITYMKQSDKCDNAIVLASKKLRIDTNVCKLNMILVKPGRAISLTYDAAERRSIAEKIRAWTAEVRQVEPNYSCPSYSVDVFCSEQKKGCYVATAVYGSYDCPQVWVLRRYRDNVLAESWVGRMFVKTYYAVSPTLVKWFGHTKWFKAMWRQKLDRMVQRLKVEGFEDTPYKDKQW